jgi:hypothetical protein
MVSIALSATKFVLTFYFLVLGGMGLERPSKSYFLPRYVKDSVFRWPMFITLINVHKLAAKLKLNAPYAHTWLEIVKTRWGTFAHMIFMFFG